MKENKDRTKENEEDLKIECETCKFNMKKKTREFVGTLGGAFIGAGLGDFLPPLFLNYIPKNIAINLVPLILVILGGCVGNYIAKIS